MKLKIGTRAKDIELRLKETFKAIESQDFLKTPFIQDLMKRVQASVQSQVETAAGKVEYAVGKVETAFTKVEAVVGFKAEDVIQTVRESVRQGQKNLDESVKNLGSQKLRVLQKKVAQSIFDRAEDVKSAFKKSARASKASQRRAQALTNEDLGEDLEEQAKSALASVAKKASVSKAKANTVKVASQANTVKAASQAKVVAKGKTKSTLKNSGKASDPSKKAAKKTTAAQEALNTTPKTAKTKKSSGSTVVRA